MPTEAKDFIWYKYETPEISQGLCFIHIRMFRIVRLQTIIRFEYETVLLKAHVPGPSDGSYMTTEKRIDPVQMLSAIMEITQQKCGGSGELRMILWVVRMFQLRSLIPINKGYW